MLTISVCQDHCGESSSDACLNNPKPSGVVEDLPIIGQLSMGFGTFSGQDANGKRFIVCGSVFVALFCTNAFNSGSKQGFGTTFFDGWCGFMPENSMLAGNGSLLIANRFLPLSEGAGQVRTRPIEGNRAQKFTFWLMSVVRHSLFSLRERIVTTNGRLRSLLLALLFLARQKSNIYVWIKRMILLIFMNGLLTLGISNILLTDEEEVSPCLRRFHQIRSILLDDGSWRGLSDGWRKDGASVPNGARNLRIGWHLFSSLVVTFSAT